VLNLLKIGPFRAASVLNQLNRFETGVRNELNSIKALTGMGPVHVGNMRLAHPSNFTPTTFASSNTLYTIQAPTGFAMADGSSELFSPGSSDARVTWLGSGSPLVLAVAAMTIGWPGSTLDLRAEFGVDGSYYYSSDQRVTTVLSAAGDHTEGGVQLVVVGGMVVPSNRDLTVGIANATNTTSVIVRMLSVTLLAVGGV